MWADDGNWMWGRVAYHCDKDRRAWVPKRPLIVAGNELQLGYTLNFARSESAPPAAVAILQRRPPPLPQASWAHQSSRWTSPQPPHGAHLGLSFSAEQPAAQEGGGSAHCQ